MTLCVLACMRDAERFLPLYRQMLDGFTVQPTMIVLGENDSTDGTGAYLKQWAAEDERVMAFGWTTGVPTMDRVPTRERSRYMAQVWNRCLETALVLTDWTHLFVSSVQKWTHPATVRRLRAWNVSMVAPLVMFRRPGSGEVVFYDTWCFQHLNGQMFGHGEQPDREAEHDRGLGIMSGLQEVAGIGGAYLARREVFQSGARFAETDGSYCESVALCHQARACGHRVYVDYGAFPSWACWTPEAWGKPC